MTDYIHIEAAYPHRPAFARWCLAQDPPIQTASASGSDVPLDLYPSVPAELLEGAHVDGFLYGRPEAPQPPLQAPQAPAEPHGDALEGDALDAIIPATSTRKRRKGGDQ